MSVKCLSCGRLFFAPAGPPDTCHQCDRETMDCYRRALERIRDDAAIGCRCQGNDWIEPATFAADVLAGADPDKVE